MIMISHMQMDGVEEMSMALELFHICWVSLFSRFLPCILYRSICGSHGVFISQMALSITHNMHRIWRTQYCYVLGVGRGVF